MSKSDTIREIAIDAGLPEAIEVQYSKQGKRWYLTHPIAMGDAARAGTPYTIIADYGSVQDARDHLPDDAARFWQQYGQVLALVGGDVTTLTRDEARFLLALAKAPTPAPPGTHQQLVGWGVVDAAPQLGSKWLRYTLTPLGELVVHECFGDTTSEDAQQVDDGAQPPTPPAAPAPPAAPDRRVGGIENDMRNMLYTEMTRRGGDPSLLFEILETIVLQRSWESLDDETGKPVGSLRRLIEAPLPNGCGQSTEKILKLLQVEHRYETISPKWKARMGHLRSEINRLLFAEGYQVDDGAPLNVTQQAGQVDAEAQQGEHLTHPDAPAMGSEHLHRAQQAMYTLISRAQQGQLVTPETVQGAWAYLAELERNYKTQATGRYTPKRELAEVDRSPLAWVQPIHRNAPQYDHEITCTICGDAVTITTRSPHPPSTCTRDDCRNEHQRALARERKRKQRAREKSQGDK